MKAGEFGDIRPLTREWTTRPLRLAKRTDVLICVVGATCGKLNLGEDCAIGRSVAAVRPDPEKLDQRYLHYFLMTLVSQLRADSVGAAQTVISKEMIEAIHFPWRVVSEQRRIVAILDEAFEGIATAKAHAEKNLRNARELCAGEISALLATPREGWASLPIESCFKVKSGDFLPAKAMAGGEIPVYGGNGVTGLHDMANLSGEQIVIGRVGAKCGNVRYVNGDIWLTDNAFYISTFLRPFDLLFLAKILDAVNLRRTANQAAQPVISYTTIKDVAISFPVDVQSQRLIAARWQDLESRVASLESCYLRKLATLDELTQSLLHQAFSGAL